MENLVHLIYTSTASHPFSADELATLLQVSRESNERTGVTGMLLYSHETFFQVLEGPEPAIDALFERIRGTRGIIERSRLSASRSRNAHSPNGRWATRLSTTEIAWSWTA